MGGHMNRLELENRLKEIEDHSLWECLSVRALPKRSSNRQFAEAVKADCKWLTDHTQESEGMFDKLIKDLGMEGEV